MVKENQWEYTGFSDVLFIDNRTISIRPAQRNYPTTPWERASCPGYSLKLGRPGITLAIGAKNGKILTQLEYSEGETLGPELTSKPENLTPEQVLEFLKIKNKLNLPGLNKHLKERTELMFSKLEELLGLSN